jgi:pyrimidine and pyridine-specific 5'-nucleotidase
MILVLKLSSLLLHLLTWLLDPLDFDAKCDGSLPLEELLTPDPAVRKLLEDIDPSRARIWALTNAYKTVS